MTIYFVVGLVLCAITVLFVAVRSRSNHATVRPLDVAAFRTLIDRDDELFLREKLSRSAFFRLKRERIRVVFKYVGRISGNASAIMRLGATGRISDDPEAALAAVQIADLATQIRLQCLMAFAKLSVEFAFPSLQLTPAMLAPKYQSLRESVQRLGVLQPQSVAALVSAI
ncbi:MAG TPA: hypothetical protein VN176_17095 [Verrucomicrobiae bacterium]|jgi:hypothetical protein|nr:hypothetical protein [Verrucomicrobiae bacterium]